MTGKMLLKDLPQAKTSEYTPIIVKVAIATYKTTCMAGDFFGEPHKQPATTHNWAMKTH